MTLLHTASLPTAISTGIRSSGLLWPLARRLHPTATGLTDSSAVNHAWPQSVHCRFRTVTFGSRLFVATALIALLEHLWHCIANVGMYPTTMAQ